MIKFLFCLGWGMLCFYVFLLVRIGAQLVPKPPALSRRRDSAAYPETVGLPSTQSRIKVMSTT